MEENVALDSSKQKQFVKSVKGIKKLIKKNDAKGVREKISASKVKDGKVHKKKRSPRGLVYLGHIPHGFYENAMTQYFKQFGVVTNARVIRSKRTGNSKGFAFVEFKEPSVAEIVAETMNNYLMGKRLIKAAYIPPEKQKIHAKRKFWSSNFNPGSEGRLKTKKAYNAIKDVQGDLKKARKLISNISKTKKKLSELGINYDFFAPVDVPESLENIVTATKVKEEVAKPTLKASLKQNSNMKEQKVKIEKQQQTKQAKGKDNIKSAQKEEGKREKRKIEEIPAVVNKKAKKIVEVNKKQQVQKEKKLKEAGVKSVENFIKLKQETDEESDSSADFNSDEFEKMLSGDDSYSSSEASSSENGPSDDSEEDSDDEEPPKLVPAKLPKLVKSAKPQSAKTEQKKLGNAPKNVKKAEKKAQGKPKTGQGSISASNTSKFENKNTIKLAKKQFKKKK